MTNVPPSSLSRLLQGNLPSIVQAGGKCTNDQVFRTLHDILHLAASPISLTRSFGTSRPNWLGNSLGLEENCQFGSGYQRRESNAALTYELGHEGNHEIEKTDGLDESETQNGVREELATESGVAGNTVDEGSEDETDTDTSTSKTNGGRTHTNVLGDLNHGLGDLGGVGAALDLEGVAGGGLEEGGSLLALHGLALNRV